MHLALIMDGNGRWATQRSLPRAAGHLEGLKACKRVVKAATQLSIDYLTLYVFSTENWKRSVQEVSYLMSLLANKLPGEVPFFRENNVKILVRGNIHDLPEESQKGVNKTVTQTADCTGLVLVLCINYGGQDEIARAVNKYITNNPGKDISIEDIKSNLDCPQVPDADLIARSAGEQRLSNFVLWDSAYAEFISLDTLWPDWGKKELEICLEAFSRRNRKFGGVSK